MSDTPRKFEYLLIAEELNPSFVEIPENDKRPIISGPGIWPVGGIFAFREEYCPAVLLRQMQRGHDHPAKVGPIYLPLEPIKKVYRRLEAYRQTCDTRAWDNYMYYVDRTLHPIKRDPAFERAVNRLQHFIMNPNKPKVKGSRFVPMFDKLKSNMTNSREPSTDVVEAVASNGSVSDVSLTRFSSREYQSEEIEGLALGVLAESTSEEAEVSTSEGVEEPTSRGTEDSTSTKTEESSPTEVKESLPTETEESSPTEAKESLPTEAEESSSTEKEELSPTESEESYLDVSEESITSEAEGSILRKEKETASGEDEGLPLSELEELASTEAEELISSQTDESASTEEEESEPRDSKDSVSSVEEPPSTMGVQYSNSA